MGHRTSLEDMISAISHLFPKMAPSRSAFLGVTKTIEILQPLINVLDKDLNTNAYLVIIYEKIWYFSGSKTIDVHCLGSIANVSFSSSQKCMFRTYARKPKDNINCRNDFFLFSNMIFNKWITFRRYLFCYRYSV